MNHVYIGYDSRAGIAYEVARKSIWRRTSTPLTIYPLRLSHLGMLTRPIEKRDGRLWCPISDAPMSTEFAISRFCVPFLQQTGWALFSDCDILCWSDINELFALADPRYAVMVVKHDQYPDPMAVRELEEYRSGTLGGEPAYRNPMSKMDGQIQTYYSRKNWSSVVLWNLDHSANKRFTLEMLNTLPGRDLHAFCWLNDYEIGELPMEWNHLINVTPGKPGKKGIWHYTLGGPWFEGWTPAPHDEEWLNEAGLKPELCPA